MTDAKTMLELLPCPFCGGKAEETDTGSVMCANNECRIICGVPSNDYRPDHDPRKVWNTRAAAPSKDLARIADVIEPHWRGAGLQLTADWIIEQFIKLGDEVEASAPCWQPISLAPTNETVWTKIHDDDGERNVQQMTRVGNLWYINYGQPNSMYVYYNPTHWSRSAPSAGADKANDPA